MSRTALLAVVVVVACGGPTKPPDPIGNTGDPPVVSEPPELAGKIIDELAQPAIGATLVLVDLDGKMIGEQVLITNEHGDYKFTGIGSGNYELTIYYNDVSARRRVTIDGPTRVNQAIPLHGTAGEAMRCANDQAASCRP